MISLIPVSKAEIKNLITLAFEGDRDLLETYHVSPGTLSHCVDHTYNFIAENKGFYDKEMSMFKVCNENNEDVGFTVIIKHDDRPNELYSFGIAKQYRKEMVLMGWLRAIEKELGSTYYLILWSVNRRAVKFFERNGFIVEEKDELTKLIVKADS